jgi:hypothetical protein
VWQSIDFIPLVKLDAITLPPNPCIHAGSFYMMEASKKHCFAGQTPLRGKITHLCRVLDYPASLSKSGVIADLLLSSTRHNQEP